LKHSKSEDASEKKKAADRAIAIIISSYPPDLAREAKQYAVALMAHVEQYPIRIIERLCDYRTGIQTRSKFPPTIADIVAFCSEQIERERIMEKPLRRPMLTNYSREPWQCPFPKLQAAFPDRDLCGPPFDVLNGASRALAMHGVDAARAILFGD
jgi:hypothetical protein